MTYLRTESLLVRIWFPRSDRRRKITPKGLLCRDQRLIVEESGKRVGAKARACRGDGAGRGELPAMGGEIVCSSPTVSLSSSISNWTSFSFDRLLFRCRHFFTVKFSFARSRLISYFSLGSPTERSRPRQVKDVAHQEEVVRVLTNTLETANVWSFSLHPGPFVYMHTAAWTLPSFMFPYITFLMYCLQCPHMLFYGPPGTGKTTTALAIAHQLFGYRFPLVFHSSLNLWTPTGCPLKWFKLFQMSMWRWKRTSAEAACL